MEGERLRSFDGLLSIENFLSMLFTISVVGLIFPYGFPLFPIAVLLYLFVCLIRGNIGLRINIYSVILYGSVIMYFIGLLNNKGTVYQNNIADIENITLLLLLSFTFIKFNQYSYKKFLINTFKLLSCTIPCLALFSLYKFYLLLNGVQLNFLKIDGRSYPWGTTLMPDYNMFSLGMIIGVIGICYVYRKSNSLLIQLYTLISVCLLFIAIVFSGSRRGWLVLPLLSIYLMHVIIKKINIKQFKIKELSSLIILIILLILAVLIFPLEISYDYEIEKLKYRFSTLADIKNSFDERTSRWNYGFQLINEFNLFKLLIGDGFHYLNIYAEKFKTDSLEDYPHNPLISTMLYSGVIGVLVFLILIFMTINRLLYRRKLFGGEFILIYFVTLIFLLPSANTFFSIKIIWILTLIIFFVKDICDCTSSKVSTKVESV